jgi:general secretion pathway protein K
MNPRFLQRSQGVAMVVALWVIMVLSLLISGFAFRMYVETQVASFSRKQLKAEMLARAGVEVARMELILGGKQAGPDSLVSDWATNTTLLGEHELGDGKYNVKVTDEERKLPVNKITEFQWKNLMEVLGVDPLDGDVIVDSVLDWIDDNDLHRLNGAEDEYYTELDPPYRAKNGLIDRIDELRLVRGINDHQEIFEGTPGTEDEPGRPGLKDLLTSTSSGLVNVNTASAEVLQALLGVEETQITAILTRRDGADGIPGNDDDAPFTSVDEFLGMAGGVAGDAKNQLRQFIAVNSSYFHVESTGEWGGVKHTIHAILYRQGANCYVASWDETRGGT